MDPNCWRCKMAPGIRVFPCISWTENFRIEYCPCNGVVEVSQQYIYLFSSLWCAFLCLSLGKVVEDIYAKKAPRLRVWTKKRDAQATHSSTTQDILTSWCHKVQMVVVKSRCDLIGLCVSCGCQLVSSISGLARKWATSETRRRDPGNAQFFITVLHSGESRWLATPKRCRFVRGHDKLIHGSASHRPFPSAIHGIPFVVHWGDSSPDFDRIFLFGFWCNLSGTNKSLPSITSVPRRAKAEDVFLKVGWLILVDFGNFPI